MPPPSGQWINQITRHIGGPETVKDIGISTGISALFVVGGLLNDTVFQNASPGTKKLVDAVFGVPMASRILLPDLVESWKDRDVPDFLMTGLTSAIAVLGVSTDDREMMQSAAMLAALFAMAGRLEDGVKLTTKEGIAALERTVPTQATRRVPTENGFRHETVEVEHIREGDHVLVPHGETVPVDGQVIEARVKGKSGTGAVTMPKALHGENMLIKVTPGEKVPQGAIAAEGSELVVKAAATAKESTILRNIEYVRTAGKTAPSQAEHTVRNVVKNVYVPAMLAACGAQFLITYLHDKQKHQMRAGKEGGHQEEHKEEDWRWNKDYNAAKHHGSVHRTQKAVKRTAELAIKMAPCAISASLLVLPFVKNRLASECGIMVRENAALEKSKDITTVLADIRGTLTKGISEFKGLHLWDDAVGVLKAAERETEHALLGIIGKAESTSQHPLAKTLRTEARQRGHSLEMHAGDAVHVHPGLGVSAQLQEGHVTIGSRRLMLQQGYPVPDALLAASEHLDDLAYLRVHHPDGRTQWGVAAFEDALRPEVAGTIRDLRARGTKVVLVTGMPEKAAQRIAAKIDTGDMPHNPIEVRANHISLSEPGQTGKDEVVREFATPGKTIAAFGDAENDMAFLSMVKKHGGVSFAIASTGAGATKEVASVVVEGIHQLPGLMSLSKDLSRMLWLNLSAAVSWMTLLVGSHLFGYQMNPQKASIAHETPTILLVLASLAQNFRLVRHLPSGNAPVVR